MDNFICSERFYLQLTVLSAGDDLTAANKFVYAEVNFDVVDDFIWADDLIAVDEKSKQEY